MSAANPLPPDLTPADAMLFQVIEGFSVVLGEIVEAFELLGAPSHE